jgi:hypothetical protein
MSGFFKLKEVGKGKWKPYGDAEPALLFYSFAPIVIAVKIIAL